MARIRSVHPGLWTDDNFTELDFAARLLLIGLWTEADDGGVFQWKAKKIKGRIFVHDDITRDQVEEMLVRMVEENLIARYEVEGRFYGVIRNFGNWQSPRRPSYTNPATPEMRDFAKVSDASVGKDPALTTAIPDNVRNDPDNVRTPAAGEERRGEEGRGREQAAAREVAPVSAASLIEKVEEAAGADSSKSQYWATSGIPTAQVWLDNAKAAGIGDARAEELIVLKVREVKARDPSQKISRPSYFNNAVSDAIKREKQERPATGFKAGKFGAPRVREKAQ